MKTELRRIFALTLFLSAAGFLQAQVEFYLIDKKVEYVQTSSAAPTLTNYRFSAEINGSGDLSLITNHAATSPGGTGSISITNYSMSESRWTDHHNYGTDKSAMDTDFNNGLYLFDVDTVTGVNLNLGGTANMDLYPATPPQITGMDNGAFWNGSNQLVLSTTGTTTLTINPFSLYSSLANGQVGGHIGMEFYQTSGSGFSELSPEAFSIGGSGDAAFNTFVISGLTAGTYQFNVEYNVLTAVDQSSLSGATGVAIFTNFLSVQVVAVPEPATCAEILGIMVLAGAMLHRRRRLA